MRITEKIIEMKRQRIFELLGKFNVKRKNKKLYNEIHKMVNQFDFIGAHSVFENCKKQFLGRIKQKNHADFVQAEESEFDYVDPPWLNNENDLGWDIGRDEHDDAYLLY